MPMSRAVLRTPASGAEVPLPVGPERAARVFRLTAGRRRERLLGASRLAAPDGSRPRRHQPRALGGDW
jgi:hypothetical protein